MAQNLDKVSPEDLAQIKAADPELYDLIVRTRAARDRERAVRGRRIGQVALAGLTGQAMPLADIPDSAGLSTQQREELNLKYNELLQNIEHNKQTFVENYLDTNKSAADKILDTTKGFQDVLKQMIASEGSVQSANASAAATVQAERLRSLTAALDRLDKASTRYGMTMADDTTQNLFQGLLQKNIRNGDQLDTAALGQAVQILNQGAAIGDADERNRFMYSANSWAKGQGFTDLQHMLQEYGQGTDGVAAGQNQLDMVRNIRNAYTDIPRIDQEMMSVLQQTQGEIDAYMPYATKGAGANLNFEKVFNAYKAQFGALTNMDPAAALQAAGIKPTGDAAKDAQTLADEMFRPAEGQLRLNIERINAPEGPVTKDQLSAELAKKLDEKGYETSNARRSERQLLRQAGPASKADFGDHATRLDAGNRRDRGQSAVPQKSESLPAVAEEMDVPVNPEDKSDPMFKTQERQKGYQELLEMDKKNKTEKLLSMLKGGNPNSGTV